VLLGDSRPIFISNRAWRLSAESRTHPFSRSHAHLPSTASRFQRKGAKAQRRKEKRFLWRADGDCFFVSRMDPALSALRLCVFALIAE
jgi:hypothetical protein